MANKNKTTRRIRADYSVATLSVTLVLLMLGVVGYILLNVYSSSSSVRGELRFSVMLRDTVTLSERANIEKRLAIHPAVAQWKYISADEAAADFQEYIGTDFVAFLGTNPLPAAYEINLNPAYVDEDHLSELEDELERMAGVDEVVYQQKIVQAVLKNLTRLNFILLGIGGLLLIITVMLISNTLRLSIAAKARSIETMKMVGATQAFIRRPFVMRSFTQGVIAGLIASLLLYFFAGGLAEVMPEIKLIDDWNTLALLFSGMVVSGVVICTFFTTLAVNRYVRLTA